MGWPVCNNTLSDEIVTESPLSENSDINFHQLMIFLAFGGTGFSGLFSLLQIYLQSTHYSRPQEQRAICRILIMVPIYSLSNLLAVIFYHQAAYFNFFGNAYAAIGLASFYQLLISYVAPDLHKQKEYFRVIRPKPWKWPISWLQKCIGGEYGCFRTPRSGLTFFNVTFAGVFQYCFVLISNSFVAAILNYFGRYCQVSLNPAFGHIWLVSLNVISATISGYCLSQFHSQVKLDFTEHNTGLKLFCADLVLYLSTYQTLFISLLLESGAISPSNRYQTPDLRVGLPSTLLCLEMGIVATLHLWAYSWRNYKIGSLGWQRTYDPTATESSPEYYGGFLGLKALIDALNPWDIVKSIGRSLKWIFIGRKHRMNDESYMDYATSRSQPLQEDSTFLVETENTQVPDKIWDSVLQKRAADESRNMLMTNLDGRPTHLGGYQPLN